MTSRPTGTDSDDLRTNAPDHLYEGLDSIRGIAAFLVVLYHLPPWFPPFESLPLIKNGYLMVDLFFVLSGFVIALNYRAKIRSSRHLMQFVRLRFVRLYPTHLVFLLLFLAAEFLKLLAFRHGLRGAMPPFSQNSPTAFLQNLFLIQGLGLPGSAGTFNGPSWSISSEFFTYALFALAVLVFGAKRLSAFSSALILSVCPFLIWRGPVGDFVAILRCLFGFFSGCLLYDRISRKPRTGAFDGLQIPLWVILFAFLTFKGDGTTMDFLIVPLAAGLIGAALTRPLPFLKWRWVKWLGLVSYSLYMSHAIVIWAINLTLHFVFAYPMATGANGLQFPALPLTAALLAYATTLALVLLGAELSYRWIEAPSLRHCRRLKERDANQWAVANRSSSETGLSLP